MKKILLLLVSFAIISCSKSDDDSNTVVVENNLKLTKIDGTEITDGSVITVNSAGNNGALVKFYVKNTSTTSSINVKAKCVSMINANGLDMQFCFGQQCYSGVSTGTVYPIDISEVISIPAGGQVGGDSYHFQNFATSTNPIEYAFEFYQYNSNNEVVGNKVRLTYKYSPN